MNLSEIKANSIDPAFAVLPLKMRSIQAACLLLAIGLQESGFQYRAQINGPARSYWQFEKNGINAVLTNAHTSAFAGMICDACAVDTVCQDVYTQIENNDVLAAGFARLLLWADPQPLPKLGDSDAAWQTYLRCWRPGKPRLNDWAANYNKAFNSMVW